MTLSRILSFAKDRGLIAVNPCEGGGHLYNTQRADKIWREADVAHLLEKAPPELALAMMLAFGPANAKATSSDYHGRLTTAAISACDSRRRSAAWSSRSESRYVYCSIKRNIEAH